jgi:hypothetical protein
MYAEKGVSQARAAGRLHFWTLVKFTPTRSPIGMKLCTDHQVGDISELINFGLNPSARGRSAHT